MKECECETEHSVTKLGHCRDCPYYDGDQLTMIDRSLASRVGCGGDTHSDGTKHDFKWATYCDECTSYGVCRCGLSEMDHAMFWMP